MTSAPATAARPAAAAFALHGTVAGKIRIVQPGQTLTFVFTETNLGQTSAPEDLAVTHMTHANLIGDPPCVLPNGSAINPDYPSCEPGFLAPGQSASFVISANVTGNPGQVASVRVCLDNESTGATGPCKTVPVKIA